MNTSAAKESYDDQIKQPKVSKTAPPAFSPAYVAGVIDCRGHLTTEHRHNRIQPRIRITTKRMDLLRYLAKITGTRLVIDDRGYVRRPCSSHCGSQHQHVQRQSSIWQVDSGRATVILWNIRPYVVAQKDQVERLLEVGLAAWPPARGNTAAQMKALGWEIPH